MTYYLHSLHPSQNATTPLAWVLALLAVLALISIPATMSVPGSPTQPDDWRGNSASLDSLR